MKKYLTGTLVLFFLTMVALCFAQAEKQTAGTQPSAGRPAKSKTAAAGKKTQEELIDLEKQDWDVVKKKDWKSFDRLLSEDFVWVDDSGVILGRPKVVNYFSDFDLADYSMEDIKVVMFSRDVALLAYKVTLKGSFKGEALPSKPFYIGSEYLKRAGKWINVFTQSTLAK
jgi:hypothetical protein